MGLKPGAAVADIGSGTGRYSRLLLMEGMRVIGIEANRELREAGARNLAGFPLFQSWDGRADDTGLPDHTVEAIASAEVLSALISEPVQREFRRIIKPGGWLVLVWNERRAGDDPFQIAYGNLVNEYATEQESACPGSLNHSQRVELFGHRRFHSEYYKNRQVLNWEQIKGRLLSCPGVPVPGDPDCPPMLRRLQQLFETLASDNKVTLEYQTQLHYGRMV